MSSHLSTSTVYYSLKWSFFCCLYFILIFSHSSLSPVFYPQLISHHPFTLGLYFLMWALALHFPSAHTASLRFQRASPASPPSCPLVSLLFFLPCPSLSSSFHHLDSPLHHCFPVFLHRLYIKVLLNTRTHKHKRDEAEYILMDE